MQHTNILRRHYVYTSASIYVPDLDKARLKSKNVRVRQRKCLRLAFPNDLPVLPRSPTVSVHKERKFGVVQQELAVKPLDMYGSSILLCCYKIEGCICLIE